MKHLISLLLVHGLVGVVLSQEQICQPVQPVLGQPPTPSLPNVTSFMLRSKSDLMNATVDKWYYFDMEANKAAVTTVLMGRTQTKILDYTVGQIYTIDYQQCTTTNMTAGNMTMESVQAEFGDIRTSTTHQLPGSYYGLDFGPQFQTAYRGKDTIDGVALDKWEECIIRPETRSIISLTYWFTPLGYGTPFDILGFRSWPVYAKRTRSTGLMVGGVSRNLNEVTHYSFFSMKPSVDNQEVFMPRRGVYCPNRISNKAVPTLPQRMYFRLQSIHDAGDTQYITNSQHWIDRTGNFFRLDGRSGDKITTEIHDFNTGVCYIIDKLSGSCTIQAIESRGSGVTDEGDERVDQFKMENIKQFLDFDDSFKYIGQREGGKYDVFQGKTRAVRALGQHDALTEAYFLSDDWTEYGTMNVAYRANIPTRIEMKDLPGLGDRLTYALSDVNVLPVGVTQFDTTPCFAGYEGRIFFQVQIPGNFLRDVNTNQVTFMQMFLQIIADSAQVALSRVQKPELSYTDSDIFLRAWLLSEPPAIARFHVMKDKVKQYRDTTKAEGITSAEDCAQECISRSDFDCRSFDFCPGPGTDLPSCRLGSTAHSTGEPLNEALGCFHYPRNTRVAGRAFISAIDADKNLGNAIYRNTVRIRMTTPSNVERNFRAIRKRTDLINRERSRYLTNTESISQFSVRRNQRLAGFDRVQLKSLSIEECAESCVGVVGYVCQSFGYCYNTGDCYLSEVHPDEKPNSVEDASSMSCDLYSRQYRQLFTQTPNKSPLRKIGLIYQNVRTLELCAKICIHSSSIQCKSFDFCSQNRVCILSQWHIADIPVADQSDTPAYSCDHYSRTFLDDFKKMSRQETTFVDNIIQDDLTVAQCAKLCADQGSSCLAFDYCPDIERCRMAPPSLKNLGQVTIRASATCDHYQRTASVSNQDPIQLQYSGGEMAGLAIGIIVLTLVVSAAAMFAYTRYRGGNITDNLTISFSKKDTLENE